MTDYELQADDLLEDDKYYLLAKDHAAADISLASLFPRGKPQKPETVKTEEIYENRKDFFPSFSSVPIPEDADEGWKRVISSINRMSDDYASTHQQVS